MIGIIRQWEVRIFDTLLNKVYNIQDYKKRNSNIKIKTRYFKTF